MSLRCKGLHLTLRRLRTRFNSWQGYFLFLKPDAFPLIRVDRARECDGFARESSKLSDKVRFLGRPFGSVNCEVRRLKFHTSHFSIQTFSDAVRELE